MRELASSLRFMMFPLRLETSVELSLQSSGMWLHVGWWLSNVSEDLCCFHIQGEDGGKKFLQNVGP